MSTHHAALINLKTNVVENVIVIDDVPPVIPGFLLRPLEDRPEVGFVYDPKTDTFSPAPPTTTVTAKLAEADVTDIESALAASGLDPARVKEISDKLANAKASADAAQADLADVASADSKP